MKIGNFQFINPIQVSENDNQAQVQFAEGLFARLREIGLESKATGITISYGTYLGGDFVALFGFQAGCVYAGLPIRIVRTLGTEKFVEYVKLMNTLGPFYRSSDPDDPSAWRSKGPGYATLSKDLDSYEATVRSALRMIRADLQA